ncbi:MAG: hypothetical protein C7B45_13185 [Sulfobacillus acidophilus]|uniref:Uncharacterized protein n=1 Tax=Sulfobacillus acidophilus TaxID=53633 RepID=A0A2T2WF17_9FIRM|nr:MAG: hypothetical protein C7B45_13185 [Sulfobacillus acidophilus]
MFGSVNQAVSVATVPAMTGARAHESSGAMQQFVNHVWSLLIIAAVFMVVLGERWAPDMGHFLARGFHGSELRMTIARMRIMIPSIVS